MSVVVHLFALLTAALEPLLADSATAAAIVVATLLVRTLLHPLARAGVRAEKARAALAPRIAELRKRHAGDPERLRRAVLDLHAKEGISPLAGLLPMLAQLPVFFVMYRLFSAPRVGGEANGLLDHRLGAAPLGGHWADALGDGGVFGAQGLVYLGLFAVIAAVASWTYRRARAAARTAPPEMAGPARMLPLLSFGTLVTAAFVPLAAGLHLATTTAWTAVERALLHRDRGSAGRTGGGR
ncbi:MAG TPA: membrane protein insertase YidC [Streptomyces sp.]|uniref:YidC/Oxa1 family membrane protein insertase n=1 Tax=Streptomyces sp. TaxID=1931 RepID=UPI002D563535|nr:membrane protein insertase YidC [Streptomyces sp.]HZG02690.1 membrane protein insertase YidC [Streptomyces sp.]